MTRKQSAFESWRTHCGYDVTNLRWYSEWAALNIVKLAFKAGFKAGLRSRKVKGK